MTLESGTGIFGAASNTQPATVFQHFLKRRKQCAHIFGKCRGYTRHNRHLRHGAHLRFTDTLLVRRDRKQNVEKTRILHDDAGLIQRDGTGQSQHGDSIFFGVASIDINSS